MRLITSDKLSVNIDHVYCTLYRYVAIDNKKRGDLTGPTSVVAHTSVPFGIQNIEATPDSMKVCSVF